MADKGMIRGYSLRKQAEFIRSGYFDTTARDKVLAAMPERLRGDLTHLDPAGWYPREDSAMMLRAAASVAKTEPECRTLMSKLGEMIAEESSNTFLKLVMKLMNPVRFAAKLPSFWERDMKGGYFTHDVSEAGKKVIRLSLEDVEGYDFIGVVTEGYIRFGMKGVGAGGVEVDMDGWSLERPGPKRIAYEVRWS